MRARNKNKIWGFRIPEWKQFSLAEIFVLIPILVIMGGILFNIPRVYNIPQGIKESIEVIFTPLFFWLFLLIVLYFGDTYKYGAKGYQDSDSNGWDSIRDDSRSGSDLFSKDSFGGNDSSRDSFGGGSSGGGGSSTKF